MKKIPDDRARSVGGIVRAIEGEKREYAMKIKLYVAPTLSAAMQYLRALPTGQKNLVFCEDRLTLEAERAVAEAQGAALDTKITTFARFLSDGAARKVLSKQGSVLVIGSIAARLAEKLQCFGKNPTGCAASLYETIAQLRAALITPQMLEEASDEAEPMLSKKVRDIACVYREYLAYLEKGYLDESGVLALLPEAIAREDRRGTNIVFAGFDSFTKQAAEGIRAAIESGANVTAVLLGGKEAAYTDEAIDAFERYAERAGALCEKIYLPSDLKGEAEILRRALFDPMRREPVQTDRIRIFEASDPEDELRYIAAAVRGEIARGARYRDIAVYLSDMRAYAVPLQKVFQEYAIPYYADVKRSAVRHPLCKFVLAWFAMLADGFEASDTDAFLSNPFFGKEKKNGDTYRNYLLRYANYRGGCRRAIKREQDSYELLEEMRTRLTASFEGVTATMTGGEYCEAVRRLLRRYGCEERQAELAKALEEAGLRAESEYYARGLESLERVLAEAEELAGSVKMKAEEFSAMLSEALTALEISQIPQYLDAVFVGDVSQSRRPTVKIVMAAGMTDGVPAYGADTALITDRDIDRLQRLRVEITPKIRQINARVRENVAMAVCAFRERLYLTYPLSMGGEERKRSEVITTACMLFSDGVRPIEPIARAGMERAKKEDRGRYEQYLANVASEYIPAVRELLERADAYQRGRAEFDAHTGLYAALKERGDAPDSLLFSQKEASPFVKEAAQVLLRGKSTVSPTLIEGYYGCPYRNFAERGLMLAPREEMSVRPIDTGNYMHEILYRVAKESERLSDASACEAFIRAAAQELLKGPPYNFLADTGMGSYSAQALVEEAVVVGLNMYRSLCDSKFTVFAAESSFGYENSAFEGIPLHTGETPLTLAGKIDRVDRGGGYVRVIDYKTGTAEAKALPYYTGQKLQLELYLSAVSKQDKPAGAYYFPAKLEYSGKEKDAPFRMVGYTVQNDDVVRMSDATVQEGKKSRYIDAYFGKKGKKMLKEEDFDAFLEYSVLVARKCAEETLRGCIAASPYKDACKYCPYGSVCGFDCGTAPRTESKILESEIVQIVRQRRDENGQA